MATVSTQLLENKNGSSSLARLARTDTEQKFLRKLDERIILCRGTRRSNCIGTALYLIGKKKKDKYRDTFKSYKKELSKMEEIYQPVRNCLISWEWAYPSGIQIKHLGIVTSVKPLLITSRFGADGEFKENKPISQVFLEYPRSEITKLSYYFYKNGK